jgi:hypothetical protein
MYSASQYYPITELFFSTKEKVDCTPGGGIVPLQSPPITALHIFNWSPKSSLTVELWSGQVVTYPPTALVEGAIYFVKIRNVIEAKPNAKETQVMGLTTS